MADPADYIAEIHRRLARARELPWGHHYVPRPQREAHVVGLEEHLGVQLPEDYKRVLVDVGANVGPHYGLFDVEGVRREYADLLEGIDAEDEISPSEPCSLTREMAAEIVAKGWKPRKAPYPQSGMIPIVHQGCAFYSVLLVAGECRGTVWDVSEDGDLWLPAPAAPRENPAVLPAPPTFLEWYLAWIRFVVPDRWF